MGISKITRNFQLTLPNDVRSIANIGEGDSVVFVLDNGKVVLQKAEDNPIMASAGLWKNIRETGEQYQKRAREGWKKRQKQADW